MSVCKNDVQSKPESMLQTIERNIYQGMECRQVKSITNEIRE